MASRALASLAQEAAVVRIEALSKSGQNQAAAEEAARFLRTHPASPYAKRVQRLVSPSR
jgi:outer membrane protein assembly factor BamD (BamD/ComL family)